MPNDCDPHALLNPAPDGGSSHGGPQATRALVDGLGVYTASAGSPFLTAPLPSNGASGRPEFTVPDQTDPLDDQLRDLRESLGRQVEAVPLRLRLSEEEVSGLVAAIFDLVARRLRTGHGHSRPSSP